LLLAEAECGGFFLDIFINPRADNQATLAVTAPLIGAAL